MSDTNSYEIDGVTITPIGGGYYDLSHSSLADPERVRGKETADARAEAIAKAAKPADGAMQQQDPQLPETPPAAPPTHAAPPEAGGGPAPDPAAPQPPLSSEPAPPQPTPVTTDPAVAEMLAKLQARIEELEAAGVKTVVADPSQGFAAAQAQVPNTFAGQMQQEQKDRLAALGIETVAIILEEQGDIPPTGLFVSHNGRPYMIKPGEPVDVPDFLLGVLNDAVMSAPVIDSATRKVLGYRDRMKYPYRRV